MPTTPAASQGGSGDMFPTQRDREDALQLQATHFQRLKYNIHYEYWVKVVETHCTDDNAREQKLSSPNASSLSETALPLVGLYWAILRRRQ